MKRSNKTMHILLITDDPEMQRLLVAVLEARGHSVKVCADAGQGWESYRIAVFPLVILECRLPGMAELELCGKIRANASGHESYILVLAEVLAADDLKRLLSAGAHDYVAKPIDHDLLNIRLMIAESRIGSPACQAAAKLHEERNLLHTMLSATPDFHVLKNKEGTYRAVNRAFCKFIGKMEAEIIGKTDHDLFPAQEASIYRSDDVRVMESGVPLVQDELVTGSQDRVWMQVAKIPVRDANGTVMGILVSVRNVTQAKKVEEALKKSQDMLQLVLDSIPARVFWKDRDSRFLGCNRLFAMDAGMEGPERIVGKTDYELVWAKQAPIYTADDRAVMQSRQPKLRYEEPQTGPKGGLRWLETSKVPLTDLEGDVIGMLGTYHDVTERKQIQQDLLSAKTRAESSQEKLRLALAQLSVILEATADGILAVDLDRRIQRFNRRYVEMCRVPQDILESGDYRAILQIIAEQTVNPEKLKENVARFHAHPEAEAGYTIEFKDGRIIEIVSRPQWQDGRLLGRVISFHDVTEERQARTQLLQAKRVAEEANLAKSQFLSRMSHELRTPLNAMLGFSQLLNVDASLSGAQNSLLKHIMSSGEHLLALINDLLDITKVETKNLEMAMGSVDLGSIVEDITAIMQPLSQEKGITVHSNVHECQGAFVHADVVRLRQVLLNLLSNAIKYNRDAGHVTITCQAAGEGRYRVSISDTGVGIRAEDLPGLFEPFSRLYLKTYAVEGSGIGLALSKQLVKLMDGVIDVQSEFGVGSTFWIELKKAQPEEPRAILPAAVAAAEDSPDEYTLLYIEDSPSHIKLVETIYAGDSGLHVLSAHTSRLGLELARAHKPDVILLDICLPEMDGYQVYAQLCADESTCDIPVIALSASAMPDEIERGLRAGFRRYLTKPIDVVVLRRVVRELLLDARSERKLHSSEKRQNGERGAYRKWRVLLAEDNQLSALAIRGMLEHLNCQVELAVNGKEAIDRLDESFSLVFMDISMPVIDGYDATAAIRQRGDAVGRVPIIALSGALQAEEKDRCLAAGMNDYLSKPAMLADIQSTLETWLLKY
jgi:two-component system, sensor histidine kinase and response regulator